MGPEGKHEILNLFEKNKHYKPFYHVHAECSYGAYTSICINNSFRGYKILPSSWMQPGSYI